MDHGRFDFSPIVDRKPLVWPKKARVAVWVVVNAEYFAFNKPGIALYPVASAEPDVLNYAWRDYGPRVGFWRIEDQLSRHGIKATIALNSDVCTHYPQIVERARALGWEFLAHGDTNSRLLAGLEPEVERELIRSVLDTINEATGSPPRGWLSPALTETHNTLDLLAEAGVEYVCDWCNDDQPYVMRTSTAPLLSVPYSIELNDIPAALGAGLSAESFAQMVRDQFDVLYEEGRESGRVMAIAVHPFITGVPFRALHFEKALEYLRSYNDVWFATGGEIATWYCENYLEQE